MGGGPGDPQEGVSQWAGCAALLCPSGRRVLAPRNVPQALRQDPVTLRRAAPPTLHAHAHFGAQGSSQPGPVSWAPLLRRHWIRLQGWSHCLTRYPRGAHNSSSAQTPQLPCPSLSRHQLSCLKRLTVPPGRTAGGSLHPPEVSTLQGSRP